MPLKLGLPPTVAGRALCACPDVCVMDAEMTPPTAAAAMATVIIEPKYRPRIVVSSLASLDATDATVTDHLQRLQNLWRCLWSPGADPVPPQRRVLRRALPASVPGDHSFLRCSEARCKVCSPDRSAW